MEPSAGPILPAEVMRGPREGTVSALAFGSRSLGDMLLACGIE